MAEPRNNSSNSGNMSRKRSLARASEMDSPSDSTTCSDFGDFRASDAKIMKRERNKQIAKYNRERKKEETRELQENVLFLKRTIQSLQNELAMRPSFLANTNQLTISYDAEFTSKILNVLKELRNRSGSESTAFFVINSASHYFPIICASPALAELTGFSMQEIIGQNCGFLSGLQTSRNERERLNLALQQGQDISATLLNYRKDGSTFWNNVYFANLSKELPDGDLAPYIIVGLHTEVYSRKGTLVDCTASDNGASEDNAPSPRSQQGSSSAHQAGHFYAGAQSSGSAHGSAGPSSSSAYTQNHGDQDAASSVHDDDEHTILQEILSKHMQDLGSSGTAKAAGSSVNKRARRGQDSSAPCVVAPEATSSAARLEHYFEVPLKEVAPSANHIFGQAEVSCFSAVPELQMLSLSQGQQRSNSVMSMLTADGTDGDTAGTPTGATQESDVVLHAPNTPVAVAYTDHLHSPTALHYAACSVGRPPQVSKSDSFHSLSPAGSHAGSLHTAATVLATRVPSLGQYPGIKGVPQSALRSMSGSAFSSPAGSREIPPYLHSAQSVRLMPATGRSPATSPTTTELRRSYFSALEGHFTSERATGVMQTSPDTSTSEVPLSTPIQVVPSSPVRVTVPSGCVFTPTGNTAFQTVRRSTSSTGGTTVEAQSGPSTESSAHIFSTLHPITTEGLCGSTRTSPRGGTPKRVSFMHAVGMESPISSFELLISHKHAPAELHASGASATNRLRATSDAGTLDGVEGMVLEEQHQANTQHDASAQCEHDLDPELVTYMTASAAAVTQVRIAATTCATSSATGDSGSAAQVAASTPLVTQTHTGAGTSSAVTGAHQQVMPSTPEAAGQLPAKSIKTRLSTPRYFYH